MDKIASAPAGKHPTDTEIRHLYKAEPARKSWRSFEEHLLNAVRKLTEEQRLDVFGYAQRIALARINERLTRNRERARTARRTRADASFQRFMQHALAAPPMDPKG